MLQLDRLTRKLMLEHSAIGFDSDHQEVLIGLNLAESNFYLAFNESGTKYPPTCDRLLYLQLQDLHLRACWAKN